MNNIKKLTIPMVTEIYVTFNYGSHFLSFKKKFIFPFTPFYGLNIMENNELNVKLENTQNCRSEIYWQGNEFYIDVRNVWRFPVSDETIDDTISLFLGAGWDRTDKTDIVSFKELMGKKC